MTAATHAEHLARLSLGGRSRRPVRHASRPRRGRGERRHRRAHHPGTAAAAEHLPSAVVVTSSPFSRSARATTPGGGCRLARRVVTTSTNTGRRGRGQVIRPHSYAPTGCGLEGLGPLVDATWRTAGATGADTYTWLWRGPRRIAPARRVSVSAQLARTLGGKFMPLPDSVRRAGLRSEPSPAPSPVLLDEQLIAGQVEQRRGTQAMPMPATATSGVGNRCSRQSTTASATPDTSSSHHATADTPPPDRDAWGPRQRQPPLRARVERDRPVPHRPVQHPLVNPVGLDHLRRRHTLVGELGQPILDLGAADPAHQDPAEAG